MADIEAVTAAIESIAPPYLAEEWDNSGFQIRCCRDGQIRRILVSLEISDDVISEAYRDSCRYDHNASSSDFRENLIG